MSRFHCYRHNTHGQAVTVQDSERQFKKSFYLNCSAVVMNVDLFLCVPYIHCNKANVELNFAV